MRRLTPTAVVMAALVPLAGCADMSGLNAETKFACAAPEGSSCVSVSGVYANLNAGHTPGAGRLAPGTPGRGPAGTQDQRLMSPTAVAAPYSGPPERTPERTLRVWVAPFEDERGTLYDQKYFYVVVSGGQWLIEKNRDTLLRNRFRQVYPLQGTPSPAVPEAAPGAAPMPIVPAQPTPSPLGQMPPAPAMPVSVADTIQ